MSDRYELRWDPKRPVLIEILKSGTWSEADHRSYMADLRRLLLKAPAGGFDVLSDARQDGIQETGEADHDSYVLLADAGAHRFVQVVEQTILALQTQRMIRESNLTGRLTYRFCTSMAEAEKLLADG